MRQRVIANVAALVLIKIKMLSISPEYNLRY